MTRLPESSSIDQALHGYMDGHRLLAASCKFDGESSHKMLLMSDLLTSALLDGKDSYLCGYPLRSAGKYVLARTWLAPELPRPGCVWTHSLVLDNQAIASASSMWDVMDLHRRPTGDDVSGYTARTSVLLCDESSLPKPEPPTASFSIDRARAVVNLLYGTTDRQVVVQATENQADRREDEALAFAVWQQMLPRLRRDFFFCTRTAGGLDDIDFGMALLIDIQSEPASALETIAPRGGLERLAQDLCGRNSSSFGDFLVEYEPDIPVPRVATWLLASIYDALVEGREGWLEDVANIIRSQLAEPDVGTRVKYDLLFGRVEHADSSSSVSMHDRIVAFMDLQSFVDAGELKQIVQSRTPQEFAEIVLSTSSLAMGTLGESVFSVALERLSADVMSKVSLGADARYRIARKRPELIAHRAFWPEGSQPRQSLLKKLVRGLQRSSGTNVASFELILDGLGKSLSRKDMKTILASGADACAVVLRQAEAAADSKSVALSLRTLLRETHELLALILLEAPVLSLDDLEAFGRLVDGAQAEKQVDWRLWLPVVERSDLALDSERLLSLASVLFKAGLRGSLPDAAKLLVVSLDPLHHAAANGAVPQEVHSALEPRLPHLGYFRDWDFCAKLRGAVLRAYLSENKVHVSLLRVTKSRDTLRSLFKALGELRSGVDVLTRLLKDAKDEPRIDAAVMRDLRKAIERIEVSWF